MKTKRGSIRLVVFFLFYVVFLLVGAAIFSAVEEPKEREMITELKELREKFFEKISAYVTEEEFDTFLYKLLTNNSALSIVKNSSLETNWGFGQSFFFAGSIVTTIGYGHVTPLSEVGRIFCIIYAAIGIPLTLITMTILIERLLIPSKALFNWIQSRLGPAFKSLHARLIHLLIILVTLLLFVFFLPAVIFMLVEPDWTYLDAIYYCVISMTTIGLGDYVPGEAPVQPYRQLYKICATVYLLLGLMMMMLTLATVYEIPELSISRLFRSHSADEEHKLLGDDERPNKYQPQVNEAYESEASKTNGNRQASK